MPSFVFGAYYTTEYRENPKKHDAPTWEDFDFTFSW